MPRLRTEAGRFSDGTTRLTFRDYQRMIPGYAGMDDVERINAIRGLERQREAAFLERVQTGETAPADTGRSQLTLTLAMRTINGLNELVEIHRLGTNRGRVIDKLVADELHARHAIRDGKAEKGRDRAQD